VVTHFNTTVATFCGWLQQIRMRSHASEIGFLQSPAVMQITQFSEALCFIKHSVALWDHTFCELFNVSYSSKKGLCKNKLPYFVLSGQFCVF
jgi:hypothetical protein